MFGWFRKSDTVSSDTFAEKRKGVHEEFVDAKKVLALFTSLTGIDFNNKESVATAKLANFCRNHSLLSFEILYEKLNSDRNLVESLVNYLTVNETYFFREMDQIDYLAQHLQETINKMRILCAPGSTGEEPYSIAIALLEKGIKAAMIEIVALDINSEAIVHAKTGLYAQRAFHKMPLEVRERYFVQDGSFLRISDDVKRLVQFYTVNVFDDKLFELGKFDYIFSRNMLIYFDTITAERAISRLTKLASTEKTLFFFGHADILVTPGFMDEHYEKRIKFYSIKERPI